MQIEECKLSKQQLREFIHDRKESLVVLQGTVKDKAVYDNDCIRNM